MHVKCCTICCVLSCVTKGAHSKEESPLTAKKAEASSSSSSASPIVRACLNSRRAINYKES